MFMKMLRYFVMAIFAICFVSCGEKKEKGEKISSDNEIALTPETTHIKGDLGDYFEVVDKKYLVTDDWGDMVTIEVKRKDLEYAFEIKGVEPYGTYGKGVTAHAGFGIEILDKNGNVIEKVAATSSGLGGMYDSNDMKEALKLRAGETSAVRWSLNFDEDDKPATFRLSSAYEEVDNSNEDSDSESLVDEESSSIDDGDNDSSSLSSSSGSQDYDELLKSYEQYVDKYIAFMKKAAKGDMSALNAYPSLLQKAEELSNKMENAQDDMSVSQWTKYLKITQKMFSVAQDINIDSNTLDKATDALNSLLGDDNDDDDNDDDDDW